MAPPFVKIYIRHCILVKTLINTCIYGYEEIQTYFSYPHMTQFSGSERVETMVMVSVRAEELDSVEDALLCFAPQRKINILACFSF